MSDTSHESNARRGASAGHVDERSRGDEGRQTTMEELTFEQRAIGDVVNPLEQIDSIFRRTSSRLWLGVAGVSLLVLALAVWGFVAQRIVTVETPIAIAPKSGLLPVATLESGVIGAVFVAEGDSVTTGQRLATLINPAVGEIEVVSPMDGVVADSDAVVGQVTGVGSPVFLLAPAGERAMALGLVGSAQVSGLLVGQNVTIAFPTVNQQSGGRLMGIVENVSETPVSSTRIAAVLGSGSLAAEVAQQGPLYEVQIELVPASTPSGYAWTVGEGPPKAPPITSIGLASIETSRQSVASEIFR